MNGPNQDDMAVAGITVRIVGITPGNAQVSIQVQISPYGPWWTNTGSVSADAMVKGMEVLAAHRSIVVELPKAEYEEAYSRYKSVKMSDSEIVVQIATDKLYDAITKLTKLS